MCSLSHKVILLQDFTHIYSYMHFIFARLINIFTETIHSPPLNTHYLSTYHLVFDLHSPSPFLFHNFDNLALNNNLIKLYVSYINVFKIGYRIPGSTSRDKLNVKLISRTILLIRNT